MMKGRFAPSPTGYMHLGNVWIALLAYLSVRAQGGTYVLRIEDIDRQRSRPEYSKALLEDLQWLGLYWDEGPLLGEDTLYYQSNRSAIYDELLQAWKKQGLLYPCFCNRARIQQISSAPHEGEEAAHYDGHCYYLKEEERQALALEKSPSWRFHVENENVTFVDFWQGPQEKMVRAACDDFVVKRGDGMFAYQFAVSVDDALMGITEVIRGRDLLSSTPLQLMLHKKYLQPTFHHQLPQFGHAPLLIDKEGYRLSKRQKSITIRALRKEGHRAQALLNHLAKVAGLLPEHYTDKTCTLIDLVESYASYCENKLSLLEKNGFENSKLTKFDIVI